MMPDKLPAELKKIYDDKLQIEKEKEETQKALNQITLLKNNLQRDDSKLKKQEKEIIDKAKLEARKILLDAKDDATSLISKMKDIENNSEALKELNNLRNSLNSSIKNLSLANSSVAGDENIKISNPIPKEELTINKKVFVTTLSQNGIIVSNITKSNEVQVQIGLIKTNVNIKYLEEPRNLKNDLTKPAPSSNPRVSKTKTANSEINVIGLSVDEALPLIDKFLDDCFLAKLKTARIVHGKGTGKLRDGIHQFLKKNPHVKSFRMGTYGEGEMGVTVVELK